MSAFSIKTPQSAPFRFRKYFISPIPSSLIFNLSSRPGRHRRHVQRITHPRLRGRLQGPAVYAGQTCYRRTSPFLFFFASIFIYPFLSTTLLSNLPCSDMKSSRAHRQRRPSPLRASAPHVFSPGRTTASSSSSAPALYIHQNKQWSTPTS